MKFYTKILKLGVTNEMSAEDQKYTELANLLNLAAIFIIAIPSMLVVISLPYTTSSPIALGRFEILIIVSILNLLLNKKGLYKLTRILTIVSPLVFVFILNLFNPSIHEGQLLWMPYGIIAIGSFSFSLFSFKKEKKPLLFLIFLFVMVSITYDNMLIYFNPKPLDLTFIYKF